MLSSEEQNEIMRQDRRRRMERERQADIELWLAMNKPSESKATTDNLRGAGVVMPPLKPKASQDSWARGLKRNTTVGVAPGADPANGPSMLVTFKDGTTEIRAL